VTDGGTLLGACLAGAGIARFKASGIQDLLDKRKFIELLPDFSGDTYSLFVLYPSRHLPAAKVRAFIDFIVEILGDDALSPLADGAVSVRRSA
jgi:DNA-binding transcriptional LysR family regulator